MLRGASGRYHHIMGFHKDGGAGHDIPCQFLLVDLRAREEIDVVLLAAHGVKLLRRLYRWYSMRSGEPSTAAAIARQTSTLRPAQRPRSSRIRKARPPGAAAAHNAARLNAFGYGTRPGPEARADATTTSKSGSKRITFSSEK